MTPHQTEVGADFRVSTPAVREGSERLRKTLGGKDRQCVSQAPTDCAHHCSLSGDAQRSRHTRVSAGQRAPLWREPKAPRASASYKPPPRNDRACTLRGRYHLRLVILTCHSRVLSLGKLSRETSVMKQKSRNRIMHRYLHERVHSNLYAYICIYPRNRVSALQRDISYILQQN